MYVQDFSLRKYDSGFATKTGQGGLCKKRRVVQLKCLQLVAQDVQSSF